MFSGAVSRGAYARAATIRIGLYAAGNLAVFGLLYGLDKTHACTSEGCMAFVDATSVIIVLPALYILLVLSLIGVSVRRVRDIGLPVWLAAAVPILMAGDQLFGMTLAINIVNAYTHPQNLHLGPVSVPRFLIMAMICIGFLCAARGKEEVGGGEAQRWGLPAALAFGIVTLSSIAAALSLAEYLGGLLDGLSAMQASREVSLYWSLLGTPALLLVCFVLAVRRQRNDRSA